jgi:hypothetical protein
MPMNRKTFVAAIAIFVLIAAGMHFVEVAEANPIHFPKPLVTFYSPTNQTQTTYYT